jgi:hypothetical protein
MNLNFVTNFQNLGDFEPKYKIKVFYSVQILNNNILKSCVQSLKYTIFGDLAIIMLFSTLQRKFIRNSIFGRLSLQFGI